MLLHIILLQLAARWCLAAVSPNMTLLAEVDVKHAAVPKILTSGQWPGTSDPVILVSTFDGSGLDYIYYVEVPRNGSAGGGGADWNLQRGMLSDETAWPNYLGPVPPQIFGPEVVAAAGGFIPKPIGTIDIYTFPGDSAEDTKRTKISTDKKGWFFHQLYWVDLNGDGHEDVLTARGHFITSNPFAAKYGQVMWLENPGGLEEGWKEHFITDPDDTKHGLDSNFIMVEMFDGRTVLIGSEFFSTQALVLLYCDQPSWGDCQADDVTRVVIDDKTRGPYFCATHVDINNDGRKDLLVSTNRPDGKGAIVAYEIPQDYKTGNWPAKVLAQPNWVPYMRYLPGKGAPGFSAAFYPTEDTSGKPWIAVSSDDAGDFEIMTPRSESPADWTYDLNKIYHTKGTIGTFDIYDLDGDGVKEVVLADYNLGKLLFYAFNKM